MFEFIKKIRTFFEKQACAIYLSDSHIQVVKLDKSKGAQTELPNGYIQNGAIIMERKVADMIKELLKQNSIKTKQCLLALSENQCFEHIFYLEAELSGESFIQELEKQIANTIPLPFHLVKYDYSTFKQGDKQIVFVVAVRRETIAQYYQVTKDFAQIEPLLLEPASLSLLRNIPAQINPQENILLIDSDSQNISWFLLLGANIFDSNIQPSALALGQPNNFIRDIVGSLRNFVNISGLAVTKIILSGPKELNVKMAELLKNLNLPIEYLEHYVVDDPNFKIPNGLALKPTSSNLKTEINLLKK